MVPTVVLGIDHIETMTAMVRAVRKLLQKSQTTDDSSGWDGSGGGCAKWWGPR